MNNRVIGRKPEKLASRQAREKREAALGVEEKKPQPAGHRGSLRALFGASLLAITFAAGFVTHKKGAEVSADTDRRVDLVNMANHELGLAGLQPKARTAFAPVSVDPKTGNRTDCAVFRAEARDDAPVLGQPSGRYEVCVAETTTRMPSLRQLKDSGPSSPR